MVFCLALAGNAELLPELLYGIFKLYISRGRLDCRMTFCLAFTGNSELPTELLNAILKCCCSGA